MDGLNLLPELVGHWGSIGFIVSVDLVSKRRALRIEHNDQLVIWVIRLQSLQHANNALCGARIMALAVRQWRQSMKSTE